MVSAELLARVELRCRELVRDLSQSKYAKDSVMVRPFGGLNVIVAGDLWQLPPPRGAFLGDVPCEMLTQGKIKKAAHTARGQQLVWGSMPDGVHGVTRAMRTHARRVVAELADGTSHRQAVRSKPCFFAREGHMRPRKLEWQGIGLRQRRMPRLAGRKGGQEENTSLGVDKKRIRRLECRTCQNERWSKERVVSAAAAGPSGFASAKAIFATNAVKYHVNKLRAQEWAASRGERVYYVIAKDRISSRALREKPDLGKEKLAWLQRHDQDCGALYGVLPLCIGMPVMATDHLDRDRGILRGCPGHVVGWKLATNEEGEAEENKHIWNNLPSCVFVRFETKTAWCVEGQTYKQGAVVDMQIGEAGDPLTVYIAATRVKDRTGLFIYRPFEAAPFQKGVKVGRDLLLRQWRGEAIDWAALRAKYREERLCSECKEQKPAAAYTTGQWKRTDAARVCKECVQRHADVGQPWQCMACNAWKEQEKFPAAYARPQCTFYRICATCEGTKMCSGCGARKTEAHFSAGAWKRTQAGARFCLVCACQAHGLWTCRTCNVKKAKGLFQKWASQRGDQDGQQVCDSCQRPELARSIIAKSVGRMAGTQVKVARQRHEKVIAEVVAEIARKRKLDERAAEEYQRKAARAEEQVQTRRKPSVAHADPLPTEGTVMQAAAIRFHYVCPFCKAAVSSSIRCGQVDHRRACGKQFQVKDGHVAAKEFVYTCPYCEGTVASNVKTGRVDHRGTCGNQFQVLNSAVSNATRQHAHACPLCRTVVWSSRAAGRIQVKHIAPSGQPCAQKSWTVT
eukprot:s593_g1.t1